MPYSLMLTDVHKIAEGKQDIKLLYEKNNKYWTQNLQFPEIKNSPNTRIKT